MNKDTKIVLKNFVNIFCIQRHFYLLPLIVYPFLIPTLGIKEFGILETSKAIAWYFTILISYGFDYYSTKQIVCELSNKKAVSNIISSVYTLKIIAAIFSYCIAHLLISSFPCIYIYKDSLYAFYWVAVSSAFLPTFVFQGLDKMHWLVITDIISKAILIFFIFFCIKGPSDAILYPTILAITDTLRVIASLIILHLKFKIPICIPQWKIIKQQIYGGSHIFASKLARTMTSRLPQVIIGLYCGPISTSLYTIGAKTVGYILMSIDPLLQAIFPVIGKKMNENVSNGLMFLKGFIIRSSIIFGILSILCLLFTSQIIGWLAKKHIIECEHILRLVSFLPIIVSLYSLLGIGVLIPMGKGRQYSIVVTSISMLSTVIYLLFINTIKEYGVALVLMIGECITLLSVLYCSIKCVLAYFKTISCTKK